MIRVFIADDHSVVRRGLREVLAEAGDITVVGEARDGLEVLHAYQPDAWDVLVLDLSLPRLSGTEVVRRLRTLDSALKIIVFSMYAEDQYAPRLISEGASAYLSKDKRPEEMIGLIRQVMLGRAPAPPTPVEPSPHAGLSGREFQILVLLCQSRTSIEIAAELNISPSTVSNHVARIKAKLNVRTTADIVSYALRTGLVE